MPLGSLRDQLTFPDSAGRTNPAPGESPGDTGGSAVRRHSGSGGGDSDSGEEDAGTLPARAVGGGARRLPLVRSGPAAAGYRRVASSKGIGTSAEAPWGADMSGSGRLCASPALDAELRELLSTVCLPSLLARQAGWWSTGWGGVGVRTRRPRWMVIGMCCFAHMLSPRYQSHTRLECHAGWAAWMRRPTGRTCCPWESSSAFRLRASCTINLPFVSWMRHRQVRGVRWEAMEFLGSRDAR